MGVRACGEAGLYVVVFVVWGGGGGGGVNRVSCNKWGFRV